MYMGSREGLLSNAIPTTLPRSRAYWDMGTTADGGLWHRVRRSFPSLPEHKGFFLFIIEEPQFSLPSSYNWDRNKNSMMGIGTLVSHQELKR